MLNDGTDKGYIASCIQASIPRTIAQERLTAAIKTKDIQIIKHEMALFNPIYDNSRVLQELIKANPVVSKLYEEHKKRYYINK